MSVMRACLPALMILVAVLAAACAPQNESGLPEATAGQTAVLYRCGNLDVRAVFDGKRAQLTLGEQRADLQRLEKASGAFYTGTVENQAVTFREEGGGARLVFGLRSFDNCTRVSAFGPQAQFTALGWDPDWNLAISEDLIRVHRPNWPPLVIPANRRPGTTDQRQFESRTPDHEVRITRTDRRCTDSRNGAVFSDTVSMRIDGATYSGCGGRLLRLPS